MKKRIFNCVLVTFVLVLAWQCKTMTKGSQDTSLVKSDTSGAAVTLSEEETKALMDQLKELKQHLDNGTVTQKEYERMRAKTINEALMLPAEGKTPEELSVEETKALMQRLKLLQQLLDNGTITQKEYERMRSKAIGER